MPRKIIPNGVDPTQPETELADLPRRVIDVLAEPLHVVDASQRILLLNAALRTWLDSLGLTSEVVGRTVAEAFPFLPTGVFEEYRAVLQTGRSLVTEEVTQPLGRQVFTQTEKLPVVSAGGVTHVVTILRDITARRQAEEVAHAEAELRRAIELSTVAAITAVDASGRTTYANRAFCDLVGWTASELLGETPPFSYWPPEQIEHISSHFNHTLAGHPLERGTELRFMRRSGERFDALVSAAPTRGSDGEVAGLVACFADITERKQTERQMWLKDLAIESSGEAIAITDLAGKLTYVNRQLVKMWGLNGSSELTGHDAELLFEPDPATAAAWDTLADTGAFSAELVTHPARGTGRRVHVTASTVRDDRGHPFGSILSIQA